MYISYWPIWGYVMTDLKTVEARRVEDGQDVVPLMHFDRPDFLEKPLTRTIS